MQVYNIYALFIFPFLSSCLSFSIQGMRNAGVPLNPNANPSQDPSALLSTCVGLALDASARLCQRHRDTEKAKDKTKEKEKEREGETNSEELNATVLPGAQVTQLAEGGGSGAPAAAASGNGKNSGSVIINTRLHCESFDSLLSLRR